ncbi:ABC transporter permease [Flagellimonas baculiformis]|uniref:ABC transporter permease n=1 Tax=Flagellimonas baculiformis TaxID=3067310 RepID=UPI00296E9FFC|nr:FtsX-like permease family protein [Muricauda sp. D6]
MKVSKTNYKIANAHLTSRLKQTLVAILSVTFGISMYIFMNSFMTGVNDTQTGLAFSTLAHIRIYNDIPKDNTNLFAGHVEQNTLVNVRNPKVIQYTEGIKNSARILNMLDTIPKINGITPQLNINVFFRNGATKVNGMLSGIDVVNEDKLFGTSQYVIEGDWMELNRRSDGILLGSGLAKKLSLNLNDNVVVLTEEGITKNYKVIGIVETTLASVDNAKAYIRIGFARQLISKNMGYVTDIQINLDDYNHTQELSQTLGKMTKYKVEPWQEANGQLEAANKLRNIIAIAVSLTILIVAGFGIYNIMNMTVNEKIREIAILKAMGFDGKDIIQIFLTQSVIIGILGGVAGILLGYLVSLLVSHIPFKIASLETLPITYRTGDYVMAFIFGLITTFIAGYLPAKKASQVDPVEIIRG